MYKTLGSSDVAREIVFNSGVHPAALGVTAAPKKNIPSLEIDKRELCVTYSLLRSRHQICLE